MPMPRVHSHSADLARAIEAIRAEEIVKQAGMIVIARIANVSLPIATNALAVIAEHADREVENPLEVRRHFLPQITIHRLRFARQRTEQDPVNAGYPYLSETVVR